MALSLSNGATLGSYQVSALLGKGGMGEVWRASDTRLGRDVAIKTLPSEFSDDVDRLTRFEREAKVLASLNHPNIASIYGLEVSSGTRFLVLELVEGDTLADVIKRGPLVVGEAVRLSLQIAEAIEAAHEKGVIHRDLKPANIKVTPEGKVKVLDFGLAKALQAEGGDVANSPTLSMAATAQGIILGTAAYMAPEQARGQAVDHRADIWAFGCVLFEMLTGRQAFRGEMVSDILASVLAREPEFAELPPTLPQRLRETLQRCLEKNPKKRWQAIGDLRVELERVLANPNEGQAPVAAAPALPQSNWKATLPYVAAAALVAAAATWMLKPATAPEPRPLVRFDFEVPLRPDFRGTGRPVVAFSPDGRHFAYNTVDGVYLRAMDTLTSRLIPGTEVATTTPFFSPDGDWLAFWSNATTALQKISIGGGAPVTIGPATNPYGASWGRDGQILFAQPDGIKRVPADGGTPELVIASKQGEAMYGPSLLPDGKTILYSLTRVAGPARWDQAEIIAQQPGGDPKVLVRGGSDAIYAPSGHLVYAVGAVLYAIAFDLARLETRGGPVAIVNGVQRATAPAANTASANFGLSDRGALIYLNAVPATAVPESSLGVVDRDGKIRRLDVPKGNYRNPRVSPNGRSVAVETITAGGQNIIWVYDLSGSSAIRRLTQPGEGSFTRPVWTPDGKRIAFGSMSVKEAGIYWQLADGSGLPERLTKAEEGIQHFPESFSPDGKALSFAAVRIPLGGASWSLWTLRVDGSEKQPQLFFDNPNSNEFGSAFSPDGKWIAYSSNAGPDANSPATNFAIYLQPYPPTGVKYQISQSGGAWPIWGPNGHELIYRLNVTENNVPTLNAVTISTQPVPTFTSEKVLPIQGFLPAINNREYDILPNGRELVMVFPSTPVAAGQAMAHIHTVLNWTEELKARVPVK